MSALSAAAAGVDQQLQRQVQQCQQLQQQLHDKQQLLRSNDQHLVR